MGTFSENVCVHLTLTCLGYLSHLSISCMLSVYRVNSAPLTCHTKGFTDCPQAILTCLAPPRYALYIHGEQFMFSKQSRLSSQLWFYSLFLHSQCWIWAFLHPTSWVKLIPALKAAGGLPAMLLPQSLEWISVGINCLLIYLFHWTQRVLRVKIARDYMHSVQDTTWHVAGLH